MCVCGAPLNHEIVTEDLILSFFKVLTGLMFNMSSTEPVALSSSKIVTMVSSVNHNVVAHCKFLGMHKRYMTFRYLTLHPF
jgi:hypothetical protein